MTADHVENEGVFDVESSQSCPAVDRMALHRAILVWCQAGGLGEDITGNIDFSEVVEDGAEHKSHDFGDRHPIGFGHRLRIHGHSPRMSAGAEVFQFHNAAEGICKLEVHVFSLARPTCHGLENSQPHEPSNDDIGASPSRMALESAGA